MNFATHSELEGRHAIFSPSQPSWLRYDDQKAVLVFDNRQAAEIGTKYHEWAKATIDLGIKQPKSKKTLYAYVNDAIGFRMKTEVKLKYSELFFGTADSISFYDNFLRIHDLKTGITPVHMDQLKIYAALFCLEYKVRPGNIDMELRIYQNDDVLYCIPEVEEIAQIMDIIIHLDKLLQKRYRLED